RRRTRRTARGEGGPSQTPGSTHPHLPLSRDDARCELADDFTGPAIGQTRGVKVTLRHPTREIEVSGPISVIKLLNRLEFNRESVLLVRNGELVPGDSMLDDDDVIEIRPVISGG
ncbi:MAG TPA: MoaD/ThiS family protein, partial [Microthrixaceae bacterium]|nr:MoaD/ThiS family protein [Microthrixaceae bacterium]